MFQCKFQEAQVTLLVFCHNLFLVKASPGRTKLIHAFFLNSKVKIPWTLIFFFIFKLFWHLNRPVTFLTKRTKDKTTPVSLRSLDTSLYRCVYTWINSFNEIFRLKDDESDLHMHFKKMLKSKIYISKVLMIAGKRHSVIITIENN